MIKFQLSIASLFLILLFPTQQLLGQQNRFDEATRLLNDQQYQAAYELYRSIETDGNSSGKLYYNLGLTALRLDSLGLAKYYFMQAEPYPDVSADARNAITYVDNRFNRRSAVLPKLPWDRLLEWMDIKFGAAGVLAFGLLLLNLGVGTVITSWFVNRFGSPLKRGGYSVLGLAIVMIGTSLLIQYRENRYTTGVMVENEARVHEQPSLESSTINTAYEGYTVTIDRSRSENEPQWWYVRLENGMYGWIERDNIRSFSHELSLP